MGGNTVARSRVAGVLASGLMLGMAVAVTTALPADAAGPEVQQAYAKASNTNLGDRFGWQVAVDGDTMVVGAPLEDSNAIGINGDQTDNSASNGGAAYVFTRSGSTWSQQAYLKASNTGGGDEFGWSVAISGDTIVVGAPSEDSNATGINGDQTDNSASNSGAAYVFTRSGSTWSQQAYLKASNTGGGDQFGWSVAISGDTIVVGAPFEDSNATGIGGDQADNSAGDSGAAYALTRSGSTWSQQAYLKASNTGGDDQFGFSVAISADTIVVGAPVEDSNATGIGGDQTDNSASASGAAYVFTRSGSTWSQQAYLKASNTGGGDLFGFSMAISADTVVVGGRGEASNATGIGGDQADNSAGDSGAAYVFVRSGSTWSQQAYLKASNTGAFDQFGFSVAISADTIVVGAFGEDSNATGIGGDQADNSASTSGAAYVFVRSGSTWSQQAYRKASNTGAGDQFGLSAAISGDTLVVGAPFEDSNATGIGGDQADNSAPDSGAAYVFGPASQFTTGPTATIVGPAVQDAILTALTGSPSPTPDEVIYQWLVNNVALQGAVEQQLKLTKDEVGKQISVIVTVLKNGFTAASSTSALTAAVKAIFGPGPTASIGGYARIGSTLTAYVGSPTPTPTSYTYRWYADGKLLSGTTTTTASTRTASTPIATKTLKLTTAHYGKRIQVRVTANKSGYQSASSLSAATAKVSNLQAKTISMELNDYTVHRGQRVYAEIELLAPGEAWSIVLDGKKLASGKANTKGIAITGFTIPSTATKGERIIRANGAFPDRTDPDRITVR